MDSFSDADNDCKNSHTGLSYGDILVTYDDAKKTVDIMHKAADKVTDIRRKALYDSINTHDM